MSPSVAPLPVQHTTPVLQAQQLSCTLQLSLRRCRAEDLPAMEWYGMFTHDRPIFEATYAAQLSGTADMLIADCGGFPAAQVWIDYARPCSSIPYLWAFRVFPMLQGQGVGSWLMTEAEQYIRARGHNAVELAVDHFNHGALRLYERRGYRPIPRDEVPDDYMVYLRKCLRLTETVRS